MTSQKIIFILLKLQCLSVFWSVHSLFFLEVYNLHRWGEKEFYRNLGTEQIDTGYRGDRTTSRDVLGIKSNLFPSGCLSNMTPF